MAIWFDVPPLLVGFDLETTGLDTQRDEPIAYGFAEFRNGWFVKGEEFYVLPGVQIHPGAERVHGVSFEHLRKMRREGRALGARAGATKAVGMLSSYLREGAVLVGANPLFDFTMLDSTLRRYGGEGLRSLDVDLGAAQLIDVVAHDKEIDGDRVSRPRRGLAQLCAYYGLHEGHHHAVGDSRAAGEVFVAQVKFANLKFRAANAAPLGVDASTHSRRNKRVS